MSWRNNAGITGSNNIPLGTRRRFGSERDSEVKDEPPRIKEDSGIKLEEGEGGSYIRKRGRSPGPVRAIDADVDAAIEGIKRRRKRNRWGEITENKAAGLMGLPTAIMSNMTSEQLEAYTLHLRIEEISQKLRINDVVPADGDRSVLLVPRLTINYD